MANRTGIEWTASVLTDGTIEPGYTSNPIRYRDRRTGRDVWACVKHSPGCRSCYAEAIALQFDKGGPFTKAEMAKVEPYICDKEVHRLLTAKKLAGRKVFIGDMTDVFGEWVPDVLLDRLFAVIALRPDVTFQVLTKRADRMRSYIDRLSRSIGPLETAVCELGYTFKFVDLAGLDYSLLPFPLPFPLPNLWVGVSVEDQQRADERIPYLLQTPAEVRFLSVEPLLGPVKLGRWLYSDYAKVNWVIVGGESGPNSRRFELDWARSILDQCDEAGVPFFFKQAGSNSWDWDRGDPTKQEPPQLVPLRLRDRKGGDVNELPLGMGVRDFPEMSR